MKIILRAEAKAIALKQYFTGLPCKSGHISPKLTINGACIECSRLRRLADYNANRDENLRKQKIRRDSDPNHAAKKLARRLRQDPDLPARKAARQIDIDARRAAKNAGLSKYPSIKPCATHGHVGFRFTADTKCVECNRINCLARYEHKASRTPRLIVFRQTMAERRETAILRKALQVEAASGWNAARIARQAAILNGDKTYMGSKCPYGHEGLRYTKHGSCVGCLATMSASKEKKAYDAEYGRQNRDRIRARQREYSERTKQDRVAISKKWIAENPDKVRSIKRAYKARRRAQEDGGDTTAVLHAWEMTAKKVCHWCGIKCPKKYHVDHYEPLSKGGKHVVANLVIACQKCNLKKSAKDPYEFAATVGRLF